MRYDDVDADFESRCHRLSGSIDAVRELVGGQDVSVTIAPGPLGYLLDLIAAEAHSLLDDDARPMRRPGAND